MKTDKEIRRDVEMALEWEPGIDERRIALSVLDGIVTLAGEVGSYPERLKVERVVEQVKGVRGIVNDLEVHTSEKRTDIDIAHAALDNLKWTVAVQSEKVKVKVDHGWLTLTGEVRWNFQRRAAEKAVQNLKGVTGITNLIAVRPRVEPRDVKRRIEEAFERDATIDADRVTVEVSGGEVTLRGEVSSWVERHAAEMAAFAAPGVTRVDNELVVVDSPVPAA